jgi:hypothetical protein
MKEYKETSPHVNHHSGCGSPILRRQPQPYGEQKANVIFCCHASYSRCTRLSGGSLYCLSYTAVLVYFLPLESVPLRVTVRVLPSADTTP